ncbi:hypothetical protein [Sediminispirochaeta bajacaliforniensis]|uniref:hypothetical protein n=1 Tax=Sediminispirochaeta bajacaliforniensis TaxID=148 RepID=UPI0003A8B744|nr:hypothetical protein [Sediminispirochaeta bajacaliforniensis]
MITRKSEVSPFNLGVKDIGNGFNPIAMTHPAISGIGPNVLYGMVLESYQFLKGLLLNGETFPITKKREGYIIVFFRDIANDESFENEEKINVFDLVLKNCKMKDKIRKILLLIYAEFIEELGDPRSFNIYQQARRIRKEDPNPEGSLLLQIKTKKTGFPFSLNSNYIIENESLLTEWGIEHFDLVCDELSNVKKEIGKRGYLFNDLIWKEFFRDFKWGWSAESRAKLFARKIQYPRSWIFHSIIIESENRVREKFDLPKIGQEKWKQEARLLELIKDSFPEYIVRHQYRAKWLGRQHLDIYIEDIAAGIEFHGLQHFEPVDFFGGKSTFKETQRRDNEKKKKCKNAGVKLYVVQEGYDIDSLVINIKDGI